MSARLLYNLSDDKSTGMQKQIGCMNGIFQLFDRHHFLSGRRLNGNKHKRILAPGQNGVVDADKEKASHKSAAKSSKATKFERQRLSTDSSRSSVSSSCNSSSFSSLEDTRPVKEPSSFRKNMSPKVLTQESPLHQLNVSRCSSQGSLDLVDTVAVSIHRGARGVPVRPATKEEVATLTYIDSPRPLKVTKSAKSKISPVSESFRGFHDYHQPQTLVERAEIGRSLSQKDTHRYSCDGRELRAGMKSNFKIKEQPRHSLDSKGGCVALSSRVLLQVNHQKLNSSVGQTSNLQQEEQVSHRRQSGASVVVKLMGLEAIPDSLSGKKLQMGHSRTNSLETFDPFSVSSRTMDGNKPSLLSGSPRLLRQEANADSYMKLGPSSRFPTEPTSWKRPEGSQIHDEPANIHNEEQIKASNTMLSVYAEIEKRLVQLEFKKSGKDLRALKQILKTMQKSKETLDNEREVKASNSEFTPQTSGCCISDEPMKLDPVRSRKSDGPVSPRVKKSSSMKNLKSATTVKPEKNPDKPNIHGSPLNSRPGLSKLQVPSNGKKKSVQQQQTEDLTPGKISIRRSLSGERNIVSRNTFMQMAAEHQHVSENSSPCRNSGNLSPRVPLKKSRPIDSQRTSQLGKQIKEPRSPGRMQKSRINGALLGNDCGNGNSSATRDLSEQNNSASLQSESYTSVTSEDYKEVSSAYRLTKFMEAIPQEDESSKEFAPASEEEASRKPGIATSEQPSPVSVLDTSYFEDESPSPVKMISKPFREDGIPPCDEVEWRLEELSDSSVTKQASFSSVFNHDRLACLPAVVTSANDKSNNAFPIENASSDHAYISEILSASGLLRENGCDSMTIRLHPSGDMIIDNLLHTLVQTKASNNLSDGDQIWGCTTPLKQGEKIKRKLIFDVVNEILVQKVLSDYSMDRLSPNKLVGRKTGREQLLKALCSEMDQLRIDHSNCSFDHEDDSSRTIILKDLNRPSPNWAGCNDLSGVVLDIERLIFKDLVSEVVNNFTAGLRAQPTSHCRQLLFN